MVRLFPDFGVFVVGLMLLVAIVPCYAQEQNSYAEELVKKADAQNLVRDGQWRALMHYETSLFGGRRSSADDPTFFLSPDGKSDPEAELAATIRGFFSQPGENPNLHPQCRFVARYRWLKSELSFDATRLPERSCPAFEEWRAALDPAGITLIYPSTRLNNPASAFGHTLARIDAQGQDERTRLLAYAASYAAQTAESQGLLYAVRGIFGGYYGGFTVDPYYIKVRYYNDMESRDVWEYRLNFTADETNRLVEHLWELGPTRFDYYFFDENCSYQLLALFDAARPKLELADRFSLWVIPVDTIRAVLEEDNLPGEARYRPSVGSVLRAGSRASPKRVRTIAKNLADNPEQADVLLAGLNVKDQAAALELGSDLQNYRLLKYGDDNGLEQKKLFELTKRRSAVDVPKVLPLPQAPAIRPDQGHESARAGISAGSRDGKLFSGFNYRPAYHDLLDPQQGFEKGAAIDFFNLRFRQYSGQGVRLEEFTPLALLSIAPQDFFVKPVSWRVSSSWKRLELERREAAVMQNSVGAGIGYELGASGLSYLFVNAVHEQSRGYLSDFSLGIGPSAGVVLDLSERDRGMLSIAHTSFGIGDEHQRTEAELTVRHTLTGFSALRAAARVRNDFTEQTIETEISWDVYF